MTSQFSSLLVKILVKSRYCRYFPSMVSWYIHRETPSLPAKCFTQAIIGLRLGLVVFLKSIILVNRKATDLKQLMTTPYIVIHATPWSRDVVKCHDLYASQTKLNPGRKKRFFGWRGWAVFRMRIKRPSEFRAPKCCTERKILGCP